MYNTMSDVVVCSCNLKTGCIDLLPNAVHASGVTDCLINNLELATASVHVWTRKKSKVQTSTTEDVVLTAVPVDII